MVFSLAVYARAVNYPEYPHSDTPPYTEFRARGGGEGPRHP